MYVRDRNKEKANWPVQNNNKAAGSSSNKTERDNLLYYT
jgi:hypothetical protein